jgi:hypothetical protein
MRTISELDDRDAVADVARKESRPSPKANFFIVGAPKCGTTAWFEYLRSHPDIFFPDLKEPCFFALDFPSLRQVRSEAEYSRLFAKAGGARIIGEASADYLFSEAAAEAIREYNGEAKILILLRDQEEFLPSLHNQHLWGFWEEIEDFGEAWRLSGRRPADSIPGACTEPRMLDYAALGRFHEQVERFLSAFPAGQVLVLHFRDWVQDPRTAYLKILQFLGLDDDGRREFPRVNAGMSHRHWGLARALARPRRLARPAMMLIQRLAGFVRGSGAAAPGRTINLLSVPGYKKVAPEVREEIRRYYAEDNRLLQQRLREVAAAPRDEPLRQRAAGRRGGGER